MTTREELVESVARAIRKASCPPNIADNHAEQYENLPEFRREILRDSARVAIAECEKDRAQMIQNITDAQILSDRYRHQVIALEAQCAAMRVALESIREHKPGGLLFSTDLNAIMREAARNALSPDAGKRVLAVVEAANLFVHARNSETLDELIKALVAMEGKP